MSEVVMEIIERAMKTLSVEELQQVASLAKREAWCNHGASMPWIIWSMEDFDPGDDYPAEVRMKVMAEAWRQTLDNHHFTDLLDYDWERVYQTRDSVMEDMGLA